jgi:hypothetical protein
VLGALVVLILSAFLIVNQPAYAQLPVDIAGPRIGPPNQPQLTTTDTPTSTPTNTPDPCAPVWSVVPSPNVGSIDFLYAVGIISANNIWAVGTYYDPPGSGFYYALAEHWDGSQWTIIPTPAFPFPYRSELRGVATVSTNDVWAVGHIYGGLNHTMYQLVEHWDGTSWNVATGGGREGELYGAAARSANDVWAVGTNILHWDGSGWSAFSGNAGQLYGVVPISTVDVWAVGNYSPGGGTVQTLVEHWDGISWTVVPSPNVGTSTNRLTGVAGASANDVWAVGYYLTGGTPQTLVEHWDGISWTVVSSPDVGTNTNQLNGVTAASANDVWAVGMIINPGSTYRTLVEHWDGSVWTVVPSPGAGSLNGVAALSANDAWAVGYIYFGGQTLAEHYASPCAPTATSTPTMTPSPIIVGHVTWQGRPLQPAALQQLPITLTLKSAAGETDYPIQNSDASGFFTDSVTGLPSGLYLWRVDGPKYLASSGTVTITGAWTTSVEAGLMRAGDCNDDNVVNSMDFTILKSTFGKSNGQPGYDGRADFTGDTVVNSLDFSLLKGNFGQAGAPPIGP